MFRIKTRLGQGILAYPSTGYRLFADVWIHIECLELASLALFVVFPFSFSHSC